MLRFVFNRYQRDTGGGDWSTIYTLDVDVPEVEAELTRGGYGNGGMDIVQLYGVEVIRDEDDRRSRRRT